MKKLLQNLSIKYKLLVLVSLCLFALITVKGLSLLTLKQNLLEDRKIKTQHIVQTAYGVLSHYQSLEATGQMTQEQAQAQAKLLIKDMRYDGDQYLWLNDHKPTMLMHPEKPELDGQDVSNTQDPTGKRIFIEMVNVASRQGEGFVHYLWAKPGHQEPVEKISYIKDFADWGWILGSGIYVDDVQEIFIADMQKGLLHLSIAIILIVVFATFITRSIAKPLEKLVKLMHRVGTDNDLTLRAKVQGTDEIGVVAKNFNQMLTAFQSTVDTLVNSVSSVSSASAQLTQATASTNQSIQRQHQEIEMVATAMNEMSATVDEVARNTGSTAESAQRACDEADQGKQVVEEAKSAIMQLAEEVQKASSVINGLEQDCNNIGSILDVIRGISEQTNLLALNAAIEAARAGEQGRGFAVVADEVRVLAMRTNDSVAEIEEMIQKLQTGSRNAVDVMDRETTRASDSVEHIVEVESALNNINSRVDTILSMSEQIATATEQQSAVTAEMNQNVVNINDMAGVTSEGSKETSEATEHLNELAMQLSLLAGKFKSA